MLHIQWRGIGNCHRNSVRFHFTFSLFFIFFFQFLKCFCFQVFFCFVSFKVESRYSSSHQRDRTRYALIYLKKTDDLNAQHLTDIFATYGSIKYVKIAAKACDIEFILRNINIQIVARHDVTRVVGSPSWAASTRFRCPKQSSAKLGMILTAHLQIKTPSSQRIICEFSAQSKFKTYSVMAKFLRWSQTNPPKAARRTICRIRYAKKAQATLF